MSEWTNDELERIAGADELRIASRRRDGTMRAPVTVWVVSLGKDIYVRSVGGKDGAWFRGTQTRHEGHIQSRGITKDVGFAEASPTVSEEIDRAYRTKYRRYAANIVNSVLTPQARSATVRLVPRNGTRSSRAQPATGRR